MKREERVNWLLPAVESVSSVISSAAPIEYRLRSACASLVDHAMAKGAWLLLLDNDILKVSVSEIDDNDLRSSLADRRKHDVFNENILRISNVVLDSQFPETSRQYWVGDSESDLSFTPIIIKGRSVGVLCAMFQFDGELIQEDTQGLQVFARMMAMAINADQSNIATPNLADESRFSSLLPSLPGAVFIANNKGEIVSVFNGSSQKLPYRKIGEKNWIADFAGEACNFSHDQALQQALDGYHSKCSVNIPDKGFSGVDRVIEEVFTPIKDTEGRVIEVVGFARDITDLFRLEQTVRDLEEKDRITGCLNPSSMRDRARYDIERAREKGYSLAFYSIEVNRSSIGSMLVAHEAFEDLLYAVASRIRKNLPLQHQLARRTEHSFIAIARIDRSPSDALQVADSIIAALKQPLIIGRVENYLSVSVGLSIFPDDGEAVEELFENADIAVKNAYKSSQNSSLIFTREMQIEANERANLESRLRRAVDNEEFELAFQPKIQLSDGAVIGVEALIRWRGVNTPPPGKFIPIAEECGLISFIGEWVLRKGCETAKRWSDKGIRLPISLNVSTRQFHDNDFHNIVREILDESQCDPSLINLEVTEGVMFKDPASAILSCVILKEIGVSLSIDDFGTGFSNLSYLKNLPADVVKIDRSFIQGLPADLDNAAITRAIIAMAKAMNMRVVAEGVEEHECLEYLKSLECDEVQGFYFSKPLFENEFFDWYELYNSSLGSR
jgi:diguanylate cyclase (GGDEF)-like protein